MPKINPQNSAQKSVRLDRLSPDALDMIADLLTREVKMDAGTFSMLALAVRNDGDVVDDLLCLDDARIIPYAPIDCGNMEFPDDECWSLVMADDSPGDAEHGFKLLQRLIRDARR